MFKWLVERPTTLYGFLSGIFISVATSAMSDYSLAAEPPNNTAEFIKVGGVSFLAAMFWFWLGEYVESLRELISQNQQGAAGTRAEAYEKAVLVVGQDNSVKLYTLGVLAVLCSLGWPFV